MKSTLNNTDYSQTSLIRHSINPAIKVGNGNNKILVSLFTSENIFEFQFANSQKKGDSVEKSSHVP